MIKPHISVAAAFAIFMSTLGLTACGGPSHTVAKPALEAQVTPHTMALSERASRSRLELPPKVKPMVVTKPKITVKPTTHHPLTHSAPQLSSYYLTPLQKRIRSCESGDIHLMTYDYTLSNSTSSASGAWQFLDGTWHVASGLPGRAKDYPPNVQDRVFLSYFASHGTKPWAASRHCWAS